MTSETVVKHRSHRTGSFVYFMNRANLISQNVTFNHTINY